jgi:hypothetical protein
MLPWTPSRRKPAVEKESGHKLWVLHTIAEFTTYFIELAEVLKQSFALFGRAVKKALF